MFLAEKLGLYWKFESQEDVFNSLKRSVDYFSGMSYEKIGAQGMKSEKGS